MRYPVGDGSQEDFDRNWYIAQAHGTVVSATYLHDGDDINLKSGGDTDFGQRVRAIANGQLLYWHYDSHPTTGFGRHSIYRIDGPWGSRWVHQAHMQEEDFLRAVGPIIEGQPLGRIGKSGNSPLAHLHFSIFKVDPGVNLDNVANSRIELDNLWEDPIAFIRTWMAPTAITDDTHIPQIGNKTVAEIKQELEAFRYKLAQIRAIAG